MSDSDAVIPLAMRQERAAGLLDISGRKLTALIREGRIRTVLIGGTRMISREEIERGAREWTGPRQSPPSPQPPAGPAGTSARPWSGGQPEDGEA